jgi:hypothetical protein
MTLGVLWSFLAQYGGGGNGGGNAGGGGGYSALYWVVVAAVVLVAVGVWVLTRVWARRRTGATPQPSSDRTDRAA